MFEMMLCEQSGNGGGGGGAFEVTHSDTVFVGSANSVSAAIPAEAQSGDLLLAVVMHRSALTVPTGWELAVSSGPRYEGGTNQWVTILQRWAVAGDAGTAAAFSQASSGRMGLHILAIAGASAVGASAARMDTSGSKNAQIAPVAASTGQLAVAVGSWIYHTLSITYAVSAGWVQTTPTTAADLRLGAAYRVIPSPETTSGEFSSANTPSGLDWVTATVIVE